MTFPLGDRIFGGWSHREALLHRLALSASAFRQWCSHWVTKPPGKSGTTASTSDSCRMSWARPMTLEPKNGPENVPDLGFEVMVGWVLCVFPRIFVWGSCFLLCAPVRLPSVAFRRLRSPILTHNSLRHTRNFLTYNSLTHNLLTTTYSHTTLLHTHTRTHTHTTLSHTTLSHATLTHNFLTHNSLTHTTYSHTTLSHTTGVAGVALGDIDLRVMRQARRLWHWASSGGPLGFRWRSCRRGCLCIAGVALRDIDLLSVSGRWVSIGFETRDSSCRSGTFVTIFSYLLAKLQTSYWKANIGQKEKQYESKRSADHFEKQAQSLRELGPET